MDDQLKNLDSYITALTPEQRANYEAKTNSNPHAIFDLIKQGDTVGVTVAIQNGIDLNIKNDQGMNPLHVASAHGTQLIADLIIREDSKAQFQRDNHDRLPLDVARENGNHEIGNKLEQVTYPELFKGGKEALINNVITQKQLKHTTTNTLPPQWLHTKEHERER